MVAAELLVMLGFFAVVVARGAEGGADALVGTVREHEDLPGQAGLDDAMSAHRRQVVGASQCRAGEPRQGVVRSDLVPHQATLALSTTARSR